MDGHSSEEVVEKWLQEHRAIYNEEVAQRRAKSKKKNKRERPIKVRSKRVRPCPSCKIESLSDTISGGMCLGCQAAAYLDSL